MGSSNMPTLDENDMLGILTVPTEGKEVVNPDNVDLSGHMPNLRPQYMNDPKYHGLTPDVLEDCL